MVLPDEGPDVKRLGGLLLALCLATPVSAAKAPPTLCWFDPNPTTGATTLYVTGLPTNDTYAITWDLHPVGTTRTTEDGTVTIPLVLAESRTAYVWQRGGGKSLFKAGPQLNDYHVIAYCSVEVAQ